MTRLTSLVLIVSTSFLFESAFTAPDFSCPSAPITLTNANDGSFPAGITEPVQLPANVNCTLQFVIPSGYVVKLDLYNKGFASRGDLMTIENTLAFVWQVPLDWSTYYAPATSASVYIKTTENQSYGYVRWQFQAVSNFGQFTNAVGSAFKLSFIPNYYNHFTSTVGSIVIHTATLDSVDDHSLEHVYVYDGANLEFPYVGTLYSLRGVWKSSGKDVVLVQFYNETVDSYVLANNFDAISGYDSYYFNVIQSGRDWNLNRHLNPRNGTSSAVTMFLVDQPEAHIVNMTIRNNESALTGTQLLQFKPQSPTSNKDVLLAYQAGSDVSNNLPQQIPGNFFTMIATSCEADVTFSYGLNPNWFVPYAGRRGFLFSSSLWNPLASAEYSNAFISSNWFRFTYAVRSVEIPRNGETLRIIVGAENGTVPSVTEFKESTKNGATHVADGTYMSTTFTGNAPSSSFWISFQMDNLNLFTTAAPSLETTTKGSSPNTCLVMTILCSLTLSVLISK